MKREELLESREYWITKIQIDLFEMMNEYMKNNGMNQTQLAEKLGVSKGYISQILNGNFDHKISKLVDLSLSLGAVPVLKYKNTHAYIEGDRSKFMVHNSFEETALSIPKQSNPGDYLIQRLSDSNDILFMVSKKNIMDYEFNVNTENAINNKTTSIKSYYN